MQLFSETEIRQRVQTWIAENPDGVIEVLGPTGSGKSSFAVQIAIFLQEKCGKNAEIISADSRQIFRELTVSSAKISKKEMGGIPHHGLDLIDPGEKMTVFDFQQFAFAKIEEIHARGNVPILCGGTMLWLDAVSENYVFPDDPDQKSNERGAPRWEFLKIGIHWDREKLYQRLDARAAKQFESGLIKETQAVLKKYDLSHNARTSFGLEEVAQFLDGKISREEALQQNQKRNRNYAKRQLTWWRGRDDIHWVEGKSL